MKVWTCDWCDARSDSRNAEPTLTRGERAICASCIENAAVQLIARREINKRQLEEIRRLGT